VKSVKITFWLLDINYEALDKGAETWLWGVKDTGERVLIIDRSFLGYFYALLEEEADPSSVVEEIKKQEDPSIVKLERVQRRLFGKPVNAVKIYCRNPDAMPKCARALREVEGISDCLEDDVRFSMRYLIDNNVVPCGWHEVELTEEKPSVNAQADLVYEARSPPKFLERSDIPQLRILGFKTVFYSREGSPRANRNPVLGISVATNQGGTRQFWVDEDKDDEPVLEAFAVYVRDFDPDITVGYGVNATDWPYLVERCKEHGRRLYVDRTKTEPHTSIYGHVSITGRANVDLSDYADEFPEVKVKTLENLADHLGIMKVEDRTMIENAEVADYWDDEKRRDTLKQFIQDDAYCVMGIAEAILDFALQLSNLVGLPLDHVGTAAAGFRVEWFLAKRTHRVDELIPKRVEQPYRPYPGAIVLEPKPGLHDNVVVLDFKSMYPNIMINYNLSPDTYVPPDQPLPREGVYEAPEVKHRFRKESPGFYKQALSDLITVRDSIRARMKGTDPKSTEYRVLNARQKAVKVITNAMYGYAGWTGARWYMKPVAEAAAAWGRHTITSTISMAERQGLNIVYGDTDSVFAKNEPAKIDRLLLEIKQKLSLEVSRDKTYVRIFFTEAKKRYAGLLSDGQLDIVGLEVMRGDWALVAKKVQENVLEIILKQQSPSKAAAFVQEFIRQLRQKLVSIRDLVIWKTLTKPPEEYEVKAAHVEAARMLKQKGWELAVGDKVGYVVVTGAGRLYERVKPYAYANYDEVDLEYYVTKQVVPAAARILHSFGITEQQLLGSESKETTGKKLTEFFGN
jgi:DNA polymerase I